MSRAPRRLARLAICASILSISSLATGAGANPPLHVCLETDHPPFSSATGPDRGIDHEISARVATALARPLRVDWFDSSGGSDEEIQMAHRASRLLAATGCDLIAGYPLTRDGLMAPTGRLPAPSASRETSGPARTGRLLASQPYLSLPLTVVSAGEGLVIDSLDDLIGGRVAVERGSLASAIASVHAGAALRERLLRVSFEGDSIFEVLENGAADAALIERHRFELYRARTPTTRLRDTGYRHPLAVNIGFIGRDPSLLAALDDALRLLLADGRIAEIVEAHGLGYSPPMAPAILPRLTPPLLARPGRRP